MEKSVGVTVIIPVYHTVKFLEDCFNSLLKQDYKDFEVQCIISAGDRSAYDVVKQFSEKDHRIHLITEKEEQYFDEAINLAIIQSSGRYLLFLHPDDFLEEGFLSAGVSMAEAYQAQVVLFASGMRERRLGQLRDDGLSLKKELLPGKDVFSPEDVKGNYFFLARMPSWLTLFRKGFLTSVQLSWPEKSQTNNYYTGRCALARAERICAVKKRMSYLHQERYDFFSITKEMEKIFSYLCCGQNQELFLWRFAHCMLAEMITALHASKTDKERYAILDYLQSDSFASFDILKKSSSWYRYKASYQNARFLAAALEQYKFTTKKIAYEKAELVIANQNIGNPLVSVIIPVYNTESFLEESLNSIVDQTLYDIEIICCDDGSTDSSLEILKSFAQKDRRIAVYSQKNYGVSVARNHAVSHACGKYIYFFDSDDILDKQALEILYTRAEMNELDILLFNGGNFIDNGYSGDRGNIVEGVLRFCEDKSVCTGAEMLSYFTDSQNFCASSCCHIIKRDFLLKENIKYYPGIIYEDIPYFFIMLLKGKRTEYIDKNLFRRRIRNASITTSMLTLESSYSYFLGYLDMVRNFFSIHPVLKEQECISIYYHLEKRLEGARTRFEALPEDKQGAIYGLGEYFSLFRSLIACRYDLVYMVGLLKRKNKDLELTCESRDEEISKFQNHIKKLQGRVSELDKKSKEYEEESTSLLLQLQEAGTRIRSANEQLQEIELSCSYRIGRFLTFIPRKIRDGFRCYKEHGLIYTLKRILGYLGFK